MVLISGTAYSFSYKRPQKRCQIRSPNWGPKKSSKHGGSATSSLFRNPQQKSTIARRLPDSKTMLSSARFFYGARETVLAGETDLCTSDVTLCDKVLWRLDARGSSCRKTLTSLRTTSTVRKLKADTCNRCFKISLNVRTVACATLTTTGH
jgi:ribosomal protein L37E